MNKWIVGAGVALAIGAGAFIFYRFRSAELQRDVFRKSPDLAKAATGTIASPKIVADVMDASVSTGHAAGIKLALQGVSV